MPASTDLVSRAYDLKVRYLIKSLPRYKADLNSILTKIKASYPGNYRKHFKRIDVGAQYAAKYINQKIVRGRKIRTVEYLGEANKGINDVDLLINFVDGGKFDISLKFYKKGERINYWNPTLDSLLRHLTGKELKKHLDARSLRRYLREMASLKDIKLASRSVAPYWVARAAKILNRFSRINPRALRKGLVEKLGYSSLSLTCIVDENGVFKELTDVRPRLIYKLSRGRGRLEIKAHKIIIKIFLDGQLLTDLAVYAQSASGGRTGGLRIAAWTPNA